MTESLECIYESAGMLGAEVIRGKLEAAGIPVLLRYESAGPVIGLTVDGLGAVRVFVPQPLAEEARALIQEVPESELEPED